MPIRYKCRHCETEIGTIPFEHAQSIKALEILDKGEVGHFVEKDANGHTSINCICEQCEQSLAEHPTYYALKKWLQ